MKKLFIIFALLLADPAFGQSSYSTRVFIAPQVTVFTSSTGTYTTPIGALYLSVEMCGGGGAGQSSGTGQASTVAAGNTTFGTSLLTANGGAANANTQTGSPGGTATGGDINITGGNGTTPASTGTFFNGGVGASSPLGGAGANGIISGGTGAAGLPATANSCSGGGGASDGSGGSPGGGGGAGGYLKKIITSPLASYAYAVGAAGAAQAAGTGGSVGGIGGAGIIKVTAYFQ